MADTLVVFDGARRVAARYITRRPLQLRVDTFAIAGMPRDSLRVVLGDDLLSWRANTRPEALSRPLDAPAAFDWTSAYGQYTRGKEWIRQREYDSARVYLDAALARDRYYVPALADRAMLAIRAMQYAAAVEYARTALSVDTYDGAANYYYGLANRRLGRLADARDGFEIAAQSPEFRGAAWTELARLALANHTDAAAAQYAVKALGVDAGNLDALAAAIVAARRRGLRDSAAVYIARLESADPLSHQARAERLLAANDPAFGPKLVAGVRMEGPEQILFEMAAWYADAGDGEVVRRVLEAIGEHPMALYLRAFMVRNMPAAASRVDSLIARADAMSPGMVFPFRSELEPVLRFVNGKSGHWKSAYYLELLRASAIGSPVAANTGLAALRDVPDYAPFYALRASTVPGDPSAWTSGMRASVEHDLRRAMALDSMQWRYGKLLAEFHLKTANHAAAVTVARRYAARFPSNYILGATLARAYVAAGQYRDADQLLSTLEILPYEGARDGHVLYRQVKLALAEEAITARQWSAARTHIAAARLWPERLGAGKPYDADLDERMEDSLLAVVNARSGASPAPAAAKPPSDSLRYGVGTWEADSLGNHRAVLRVSAAGDAVFAHIPWRRRDKTPDSVNVVVISSATQRRVMNVARLAITREYGDIAFQATAPGEYYAYYLPYTGTFKSNYPKITYRVPESTADAAWLTRHGLDTPAGRAAARALPHASVVGFDAVNDFSRFTPMEYIADAAGVAALRAKHPSSPFLAFAEDRSLSIRMHDDIPHVWAERGAFQPFIGTARRGEYYAFQIGVWAHRGAVDSLRYRATDLKRRGGTERLPASSITAFNFEGTDWSGQRFTRPLHVDAGKVQPIWFGVDVPARAVPGDYEGRVTLSSRGGADQELPVTIRVGRDSVLNHGDDAPAQLSRLRWLNSQLAADDEVVAPYTPLRLAGNTVSLLGRSFTFGADGMPTSIRSFFTPDNTAIGTTSREVLGAPMRLVVRDSANRDVAWTGAAPTVTKRAVGAVAWTTDASSGALRLTTHATLEFDGTAEYTVALKAARRTTLANVTLELPMRAEAAKYMMGLGQKGGYRPNEFHWTWDVAKKNQDAAWIGDVNAGLQFTLKDEHYVRPLNTNFYLSKPLIAPRSWANGGKGGCDITPQGERVLVSCYSGRHVIEAGDSLRFDFRLMITPFKPLDTKGQWGTRFFHAFVPVDSVVQARRQHGERAPRQSRQPVDQLSVHRDGGDARIHRLGPCPRAAREDLLHRARAHQPCAGDLRPAFTGRRGAVARTGRRLLVAAGTPGRRLHRGLARARPTRTRRW